MMPELGKYAASVLSAYGATLGLMLVLILATLVEGRKVRRDMRDAESRKGKDV